MINIRLLNRRIPKSTNRHKQLVISYGCLLGDMHINIPNAAKISKTALYLILKIFKFVIWALWNHWKILTLDCLNLQFKISDWWLWRKWARWGLKGIRESVSDIYDATLWILLGLATCLCMALSDFSCL